MDLENVLAKVPGEDVSAASRMLPAAVTDTVNERTTDTRCRTSATCDSSSGE
jgi:hypothetical protein